MKSSLIIASPNRERVLCWKQGLNDFVNTSIITDKLDMLRDSVMRIEPDVILLDSDFIGLNSLNDVSQPKKAMQRNPSYYCRQCHV